MSRCRRPKKNTSTRCPRQQGTLPFLAFQFSVFITSSDFLLHRLLFFPAYGGGSVRVMFVQDRENPACAIDSVIITRSSQTSVSRDSSTLFYVQPAPTGRRPRLISEARWALATHRVHACRHGTNYRDEAVVNLPQATSLGIDLTY
jgi:hypothetical protein